MKRKEASSEAQAAPVVRRIQGARARATIETSAVPKTVRHKEGDVIATVRVYDGDDDTPINSRSWMTSECGAIDGAFDMIERADSSLGMQLEMAL